MKLKNININNFRALLGTNPAICHFQISLRHWIEFLVQKTELKSYWSKLQCLDDVKDSSIYHFFKTFSSRKSWDWKEMNHRARNFQFSEKWLILWRIHAGKISMIIFVTKSDNYQVCLECQSTWLAMWPTPPCAVVWTRFADTKCPGYIFRTEPLCKIISWSTNNRIISFWI